MAQSFASKFNEIFMQSTSSCVLVKGPGLIFIECETFLKREYVLEYFLLVRQRLPTPQQQCVKIELTFGTSGSSFYSIFGKPIGMLLLSILLRMPMNKLNQYAKLSNLYFAFSTSPIILGKCFYIV